MVDLQFVEFCLTERIPEGTQRHMQSALQIGATLEEIKEVLKLGIAQGVQACNLGVPMLAEELICFKALEKT